MKKLLLLALLFPAMAFAIPVTFFPTDGDIDMGFLEDQANPVAMAILAAGQDPNAGDAYALINVDPFAGEFISFNNIQTAEVDPALGGGWAFQPEGAGAIVLPTSEHSFWAFDEVDSDWHVIEDTDLTQVGSDNWIIEKTLHPEVPGASFKVLLSDEGTFDVLPPEDIAMPLPSAVWLFGAGLVGLVGVARRRVH